MLMIYLCIALIFSASTGGKIQGTVIDSKTGKPVADANILVLNTEIGAATDARGNFFILNVLPGRYAVEVSCMGYGPKRIENVIVEYDKAARLAVSLEPTAIELTPVIVTSERPPVSKDMVASTYIVRRHELSYLPFDYTHEFIAFQPAVARTDTALHVRGGRATEVQYIIDNVSIIDPQTGDLAIQISRGVVDEVIFLPGGFDAEYGRAMSGIINMISPYPSAALGMRFHGKTERIIPAYNDFSYENFQSSVHLPVTN
jgi:hypothetical protein